MLLGAAGAIILYRRRVEDPLSINLLRHKFYFDELYRGLINATQGFLARLSGFIDRWIIDATIVRGSSGATWSFGALLRLMALEMMSAPGSHEHYLDSVPELPWSKVGGQESAIEAIKDAIELPLLHPHLFAKFQHATPKGFLLYGPPGCGKTLIGKATAYNLTRQLRVKATDADRDVREYFMHGWFGLVLQQISILVQRNLFGQFQL